MRSLSLSLAFVAACGGGSDGPPDLAGAPSPDFATPSSPADFASAPDLTAGADLAAVADLATPPDLAAPPDLQQGPTWTVDTPPAITGDWSLTSVSFPSATAGWAAGNTYLANSKYGGLILQYAAGAWTSVTVPYSSTDYYVPGISFASTSEGWAAGQDRAAGVGFLLHYASGAWSQQSLAGLTLPASWFLHSISFAVATDGWAVGTDSTNKHGILLHYANGAWSVDTPPAVSAHWQLNRVHALSAGEAWAVGEDITNGRASLLHYTGGAWTAVDTSGLSTSGDWNLWGVGFTASGEGWAGGYDYGTSPHGAIVLRCHGGVWSNVTAPTFATSGWGFNSVSGASGADWIVGEDDSHDTGLLFHWDGSNWTETDLAPLVPGLSFWLYGNSFPSASEGWAVGETSTGGLILHLH